tara:strand:+ start:983 stop:1126 length:144 start_codon:yes stop_codon:yes gene_type:complete
MIDRIREAMTRKVYRYLDNVVKIINIWGLEDDFVSYFKEKLNDIKEN